jgi:phage baseplate assembly protein W
VATPLYKKSPVGISFPIQRGNTGFFEQTFDSNESSKTNIKLLLSTYIGERRLNPSYGTKLWTYLFENIDDTSEEILKNIISEDVNKWIPDIKIISVSVAKKANSADNYTFIITMTFYSSQYAKELQVLSVENSVSIK